MHGLTSPGSRPARHGPGAAWLLALALLLLSACAPSPAARPASGASAPPAANPTEGAPAASPSAWDTTLAAARQEGRVVVSGAPGQIWRDALSTFSQEYPGIQVEYTGINSRDFWPRVFQERNADQFLWDVRVG